MTLTGDDYRYGFAVDAKQRFIDSLRERFNVGASYGNRLLKWNTIIERKANELGRFLIRKSQSLDFVKPAPKPEMQDNREMRTKILALSAFQARQSALGRAHATICATTQTTIARLPLISRPEGDLV